MEPKSWKWIQGAVIVMAAMLGIALAVWYERRPVDNSVPILATVPPRKVVFHGNHPDVFPSLAPRPAATGRTASAAPGGPDAPIPVPSQSPVNSWQTQAVDPSVHLSIPATGASVAPGESNPAFPAAPPTGLPSEGGQSATPSPYIPAAPSASASPFGVLPPSSSSPGASPTVSPFGGTGPAGGGGGAPAAPGTAVSSPTAAGSGTGPASPSGPGTPGGSAGPTPAF